MHRSSFLFGSGHSRIRQSFGWLLVAVLASLSLTGIGCGEKNDKTSLFDHEHEFPAHTPLSRLDLGKKIRDRITLLEQSSDDSVAKSELNDLISWSAEIAADTNIGEERWMPIYELSEAIRLSINADADHWDTQRRDQAIRLCQLTEDAWRSLPPDHQVMRLLDHGHEHGHGDHEHGDHDHEHHDHEHHDHEHDDHGHSHDDHEHESMEQDS